MSTELKIPDSTLWSGVGFVIGWAIAVERRIFRRPTRKEIKEDLNEIKEHLQRQDETAEKHRDTVSQTLNSLNTKVTVLQTRSGYPPTGDTGRYKS